jgi:hypothetical protein
MGVVHLEAVRVQRLAEELSGELQAVGAVWAPAEEIDDIDRWRRAARSAGRSLGWRVRTGISEDRVWAVSEDYEPPLDADRDAALRFSGLIEGPFPLAPSRLDSQRRPAGRGRGSQPPRSTQSGPQRGT